MPRYLNIIDEFIPANGLLSTSYDDRLFVIRPPQRRFKWRNKQIGQLLDDIVAAREAGRDSYYLGTLLLAPLDDGRRLSIIDGQQRLTTISMLLAVLRDNCLEYDSLRYRTDEIQKLISRLDNDGRPIGDLVITLQEPDNQRYISLVKERASTTSDSFMMTRLDDAVIYLKQRVNEYLGCQSNVDKETSLRDLCEYIQVSVKFLVVLVLNESEGYLVFDTANTRGMTLSPYERLKARLTTTAVRKFGDIELSEELIRVWDQAAGKLENAGLDIDSMNDYLHAIWSSERGVKLSKNVETIEDDLIKPEDFKSFIGDVDSYWLSYLAVVQPSSQTLLT